MMVSGLVVLLVTRSCYDGQWSCSLVGDQVLS